MVGDGRLAPAVKAAGRAVAVTDLYLLASEVVRFNFLHGDPCNARSAIAVTNPLFTELDAFLSRGFELLDRRVILRSCCCCSTITCTARNASRQDVKMPVPGES